MTICFSHDEAYIHKTTSSLLEMLGILIVQHSFRIFNCHSVVAKGKISLMTPVFVYSVQSRHVQISFQLKFKAHIPPAANHSILILFSVIDFVILNMHIKFEVSNFYTD